MRAAHEGPVGVLDPHLRSAQERDMSAHYTDFTAASCWLCDHDGGELCHVHDPREHRYLAVRDGFVSAPEEPCEIGWTTDAAHVAARDTATA
jgi:hypothetical protein